VLGKPYDHNAALLGFDRITNKVRCSKNFTEEQREVGVALIEAAWNLGNKEPPRA